MADNTKIEWSDATWNPVTGCTKVSAGCDNCYAETFAERFRGVAGHHFENGFDLALRPERLDQPLRWKRPRRIFVNSMSDLFHDGVPNEYIARVFAVMAAAEQHTFQILTKRHGRLRSLLSYPDFELDVFMLAENEFGGSRRIWPLPNVWLGVSVENQQWADIRIPALLDTPAAVRWISAEPLLGPVDLTRLTIVKPTPPYGPGVYRNALTGHVIGPDDMLPERLDWVVTGGESGPHARPAHPDWFRVIRQHCSDAGVAYLHKQNGEWQSGSLLPGQRGVEHVVVADGRHEPAGDHFRDEPRTALADARLRHEPGTERATIVARVGKKAAGRELDGRTWDQYPQPAGVPA